MMAISIPTMTQKRGLNLTTKSNTIHHLKKSKYGKMRKIPYNFHFKNSVTLLQFQYMVCEFARTQNGKTYSQRQITITSQPSTYNFHPSYLNNISTIYYSLGALWLSLYKI